MENFFYVFDKILWLGLGFGLKILLDAVLKNPKVRVSGSGAGQFIVNEFQWCSITIQSEPGWFGIKIPPTQIFGKEIHGYMDKSVPIERIPIKNLRADILDKESGETLGCLWWYSNEDSKVTETRILESGDSATLILFARKDNEFSKYFVYTPINSNISLHPRYPDGNAFNDTREFIIRLTDQSGRFKHEEIVKVSKKINGGRLYLETKESSVSF